MNRPHLRLVADVALRNTPIRLSKSEYQVLDAGRKFVSQLLDKRRIVYGITTGFGPPTPMWTQA